MQEKQSLTDLYLKQKTQQNLNHNDIIKILQKQSIASETQPFFISQTQNTYNQLQYISFFSNLTYQKSEFDIQLQNNDGFDIKQRQVSADQILRNNEIKQKLMIKLQQKLKKNKFNIINEKEVEDCNIFQMQIQVLNEYAQFQIYEIFCHLGKYTKKYTVFNSSELSFRHCNQLIGIGTYGQIYKCQHFSFCQNAVVKCNSFIEEDESYSLKNQIKQFFLYDLMSTLQIGPKIYRLNGFDFVIFRNCIEFEIQRCQQSHIKNYQKDLKHSLFKMHLLKIVHSDIKPNNIMFSTNYNKNIFIDFGISDALKANYNQKSLISFKGTFQYCGEEMKRLFSKREACKINLYVNDVQMLKKTFDNKLKFNSNQNQQRKKGFQWQREKQLIEIHQNQKNKIYELLISLKYDLFIHQKRDKPNKQALEHIKYLSDFKENDLKSTVTINLLEFSYLINSNSLIIEQIIKQIILKHKQSYLLILQYEYLLEKRNQKYLKQNNKENALIKCRKAKMFFEQQKGEESRGSELSKEGSRDRKWMQNASYILRKEAQMNELKMQSLLGLIVECLGFWKSQNWLNVSEKQGIAKSCRKFIQQKLQCSSYQKYPFQLILPLQPFSVHNCSNLSWIFAFLLNYSMTIPFSSFQFTHLLPILKTSIFLSFQYYYFLQDCILAYLKYFINAKKSFFLTNTIIEFHDLTFLTQKHYLICRDNISFKKKCFRYLINKICNQLTVWFQQSIDKQNQIKNQNNIKNLIRNEKQFLLSGNEMLQKINIIKQLKNLFIYEFQLQTKQFITPQMHFINEIIYKILKNVRKQFKCQQNLQNTPLIQQIYEILYCYCKKNGISIEKFNQNAVLTIQNENFKKRSKLNVLDFYLINQFQWKLKSQGLSFYFFIKEKFNIAINYQSQNEIQRIINILTGNFGQVIGNYSLLKRIWIQLRNVYLQITIYKQNINRLIHKILLQMMNLKIQLIKYFFEDRNQNNKKQICQCLRVLDEQTLIKAIILGYVQLEQECIKQLKLCEIKSIQYQYPNVESNIQMPQQQNVQNDQSEENEQNQYFVDLLKFSVKQNHLLNIINQEIQLFVQKNETEKQLMNKYIFKQQFFSKIQQKIVNTLQQLLISNFYPEISSMLTYKIYLSDQFYCVRALKYRFLLYTQIYNYLYNNEGSCALQFQRQNTTQYFRTENIKLRCHKFHHEFSKSVKEKYDQRFQSNLQLQKLTFDYYRIINYLKDLNLQSLEIYLFNSTYWKNIKIRILINHQTLTFQQIQKAIIYQLNNLNLKKYPAQLFGLIVYLCKLVYMQNMYTSIYKIVILLSICQCIFQQFDNDFLAQVYKTFFSQFKLFSKQISLLDLSHLHPFIIVLLSSSFYFTNFYSNWRKLLVKAYLFQKLNKKAPLSVYIRNFKPSFHCDCERKLLQISLVFLDNRQVTNRKRYILLRRLMKTHFLEGYFISDQLKDRFNEYNNQIHQRRGNKDQYIYRVFEKAKHLQISKKRKMTLNANNMWTRKEDEMEQGFKKMSYKMRNSIRYKSIRQRRPQFFGLMKMIKLMKRYEFKDIQLYLYFYRKDEIRYIQNKDLRRDLIVVLQDDQEVYKRISEEGQEKTRQRILVYKKTIQYYLVQRTIEIMNKIVDMERKVLQYELNCLYGIRSKDLNWQMIIHKLCN